MSISLNNVNSTVDNLKQSSLVAIPSSNEPTVRPDGSALQQGDIWIRFLVLFPTAIYIRTGNIWDFGESGQFQMWRKIT